MLSVTLGVASTIMGATVLNVAVPAVMREFQVGQDTAQWLMTGFQAGMTLTMLLAAWLESAFGARRVFLWALMVFVLAGVAGSIAPNTFTLSLARLMQGTAAGVIQPLGMALAYKAFPPDQRGRAMGVFSLGNILMPAIGPALGGVVVDWVGWRWLLFATTPMCVLSLLLCARTLPRTGPAAKVEPFDTRGFIALIAILSGVLMTLSAGPRHGWGSVQVLIWVAVTVVSGVLFVRIQRRSPAPLLNLELLKAPGFVAVLTLAFIFGVAVYGSTYVIPLYVQTVAQYSAAAAGSLLAPGGLALALSIAVSGRMSERFKARQMMMSGFTLLVVSFLGLALADPRHTAFLTLVLIILIGRVGLGMVIPSLSLATMRTAGSAHTTSASGTMSFCRQLGATLGVSGIAAALASLEDRLPNPSGAEIASAHAFAIVLMGLAVFYICALLVARRVRA